MIELKGKYNKNCKIFTDNVEHSALNTIHRILDSVVSEELPIRIMPDVHQGVGIVIGFTMPLGRMLSPNYVGVDIGCSVNGGFFKSKKKLDLVKIDELIRESIPMGFNLNKTSLMSYNDFPFDKVQEKMNYFVKIYNKKFNTNYDIPEINENWLKKLLKRIGMENHTFWNSLSSLGGGNHYIEIGINDDDEYLVSVHSGSRNLGQRVCRYHVNQSKLQTNFSENEYSKKLDDIRMNTYNKKDIPKKIKLLKKKLNIGIDKEFLQGEFLFNYLVDMVFTQYYASINRNLMMNKIKEILNVDFDKEIETVHNYVDFSNDDFMIRKGAVSAKKDEICLIPISQKFGTVLVRSKGNKDWNESLCHGAGRVMSRSDAKNKITLNEVKKSMKGIVCRINKNIIDESEFCYKKPNIIMSSIQENSEILSIYKPILNIKDIGETISWKEKKEKIKKERERRKMRFIKMKRF
jgi:RNA-splicing ligase RtcB